MYYIYGVSLRIESTDSMIIARHRQSTGIRGRLLRDQPPRVDLENSRVRGLKARSIC